MKKLLIILLLVLLGSPAFAESDSTKNAFLRSDLFKKWRYEKMISETTFPNYKKLVDTTLMHQISFDEDNAFVLGRHLSKTVYEIESLNSDSAIQDNFSVGKEEMGITAKNLTGILINSPDSARVAFIYADKKLFIGWNGTTYVYVPEN
jgi:hypothetical protein